MFKLCKRLRLLTTLLVLFALSLIGGLAVSTGNTQLRCPRERESEAVLRDLRALLLQEEWYFNLLLPTRRRLAPTSTPHRQGISKDH